MEEIIQLKDQFYVLATSSLADQRTRVLKYGDAFGVFDVYGNVQPIGIGVQGIFEGATRYLSLLELRLHNVRPLLLSSMVKSDNTLLTVDLMNRDAVECLEDSLLPGTLHLFRSKFLWGKSCHERIRISNYGRCPVELDLSLRFKNDFADIFEIRGSRREKRGELLPSEVSADEVVLAYRGLDGVVRRTRLQFAPVPTALSDSEVRFVQKLPADGQATFFLTVSWESEESEPTKVAKAVTYAHAYARLAKEMRVERSRACEIVTSNERFNTWLSRSIADLHMMVTQTPYGPYPYAGVPLFNTVFGRDGLITAYQALWVNPDVARGVLRYLAATQSDADTPEQDAEPGKILHEVRCGEMVALGEVPFRRYYGSVDSTPLFLLLAAAYYERTGDRELLEALWPNLERALAWLDRYGDVDGDGFVEYFRRSPNGLTNQGWKDSFDSIFHADGQLAHGPIALCEIQAYTFEAKRQMAKLYRLRGEGGRAADLEAEAERLRERFEKAFWMDDLSTYALALDGKKRPCRVRSSNAGHALFSGIATPERAQRVMEVLMSDAMFSGWGIRTIAEGESRYNPMSYHDGSVWPHDNSLVAEGLSRYGRKDLVNRILDAFLDAGLSMDQTRLPELFCGFARRAGEGPTLYPVACSPQSWASASVFLLLKAALGLSIDAVGNRVAFDYPQLPAGLEEVRLFNLRVGKSSLDLLLQRHGDDVGVNILRRTGHAQVVLVK